MVSPPTQQLVLRTRWEQLAGRLGGTTKKSPAECAGCRRGPDLPTAPGRAPQPRGGAQVGPTRLSLSQEPSLRVTARGPPTDQRARELAAAGGATAGVASSCPHPHRPVLLEIVGDGPVPGRLVTLQPSSRAVTQTPRAARSGRGRTGRGPAGRGGQPCRRRPPFGDSPVPAAVPPPGPGTWASFPLLPPGFSDLRVDAGAAHNSVLWVCVRVWACICVRARIHVARVSRCCVCMCMST